MASVSRRNHPSQLRGQLGPPRVRVVRVGDLNRLRRSLGDGFPSYLDQSRIEEITQRARGGGRGQAGGAGDRSSGAQAQRRSNQSCQDLHLGTPQSADPGRDAELSPQAGHLGGAELQVPPSLPGWMEPETVCGAQQARHVRAEFLGNANRR